MPPLLWQVPLASLIHLTPPPRPKVTGLGTSTYDGESQSPSKLNEWPRVTWLMSSKKLDSVPG